MMTKRHNPHNNSDDEPIDPIVDALQPWSTREISSTPIRATHIVTKHRKQQFQRRMMACAALTLLVIAITPFAMKRPPKPESKSSQILADRNTRPSVRSLTKPTQQTLSTDHRSLQPISLEPALNRSLTVSNTLSRSSKQLAELEIQLQQNRLKAMRNKVIANMPTP